MKGVLIIAPLIMVVAVGVALRITGYLDGRDRDKLSWLLYWVILPSLLFRTTYLSASMEGQKNLIIVVYLSLLIVPLCAIALSFTVRHGDRRAHALSAMMSTRSNSIYLGMPVVSFALGDEGMAAVSVFLAILLPVYDVFSVLWGEALLSRKWAGWGIKAIVLKIVKNPLVISSILGFFASGAEFDMPAPLLDALKLIGDMASGLALIILGIGLEWSNSLEAFRLAWPDVVVKLLIHPAGILGLFSVWPASGVLLKTAVIISAMPTAVYSFIVAGGMGLDS
jgi:predicted permease